MKKPVIRMVAVIFFFGLMAACGGSPLPENDRPIGAIRQHDTRIIIVCKDSQGHYYEKSLHQSELVTCGKATFRCEDLAKLGEKDRYIAFPGQEKELRNYLKGKGEEKIIVVNGPVR